MYLKPFGGLTRHLQKRGFHSQGFKPNVSADAHVAFSPEFLSCNFLSHRERKRTTLVSVMVRRKKATLSETYTELFIILSVTDLII